MFFYAGQIEHVFDRFTSFDISSLSFLPSKSGVGFSIFAISKSAPNVIHFDLMSRKLTVVEGGCTCLQKSIVS